MHWSIKGLGSTGFVSCTDGLTVLKGYQLWENGKLCACRATPCEDIITREATVYEVLGRHPQILRFFGREEVYPNVHSLRLELAPLGNIRQYIEEHHDEPPPEDIRLQMALETSLGLNYLHSKGVRHSDLSCRNLFLFPDYRVKIGDFGGSVLEGLNFAEIVSEEVSYELPRRGRDFRDRPVMKREIFALGSAIYEIMAWKKPFSGLSDDEVEARYDREEFPCLHDIRIATVIQDCWDEKYENTGQVIESLKLALERTTQRNHPSMQMTKPGE